MSGAAAILAMPSLALGQSKELDMVLRRPKEPGEDGAFYTYSQAGDYLPIGTPLVVTLDFSRMVLHFPRYVREARLVVFSHGTLGDPQVYRRLINHWVSHGFAVVAPVHEDGVFERGLLARVTSTQGKAVWEVDRLLNDPDAWQARADTCALPFSYLERLEETLDMSLNVERPIIVGHEFGAFVAQLQLGATVTMSDTSAHSLANPAWYAGIFLSPQGAGIMGLTDTSWQGVTRPFMAIAGDSESDFTLQEPLRKLDCFYKAPAGNKHLAWIKGGQKSLYLGPRAGTRQTSSDLFEDLLAVSTAMLDAYGNYREEPLRLLAGSWAEGATGGTLLTRYR